MPDDGEALYYLACGAPEATANQSALLVMLHGYGSDEEDLLGLAPHLDPRLLAVGVRGPLELDTGGYAWFPLEISPAGIVPDYEAAQASGAQVRRLVEKLQEEYRSERVFLLGFSQGASLALALALAAPPLFAGVVSLSGFCAPQILPGDEESVRGLPLFMSHGRWDAVIPIRQARASRRLLERLPLELSYKEYNMGHEIGQECLDDLRAWLRGAV